MNKNKIGVVDRQKRALVDTWPAMKGRANIAVALDEQHHRLLVGCRNTDMIGAIVIFDTQTGEENGDGTAHRRLGRLHGL